VEKVAIIALIQDRRAIEEKPGIPICQNTTPAQRLEGPTFNVGICGAGHPGFPGLGTWRNPSRGRGNAKTETRLSKKVWNIHCF
jgi:hypothetical protein